MANCTPHHEHTSSLEWCSLLKILTLRHSKMTNTILITHRTSPFLIPQRTHQLGNSRFIIILIRSQTSNTGHFSVSPRSRFATFMHCFPIPVPSTRSILQHCEEPIYMSTLVISNSSVTKCQGVLYYMRQNNLIKSFEYTYLKGTNRAVGSWQTNAMHQELQKEDSLSISLHYSIQYSLFSTRTSQYSKIHIRTFNSFQFSTISHRQRNKKKIET